VAAGILSLVGAEGVRGLTATSFLVDGRSRSVRASDGSFARGGDDAALVEWGALRLLQSGEVLGGDALARRVLARTPIDLATGWVNVIWQGDANRLALRALAAADTPPVALNVTGPMVAVRTLAERLGAAAGEAPVFVGTEAPDALVANVDALQARLPHDPLPLDALGAWAVAWVRGGGRLLDRPTRYEVRDGRF